MTNANFKGLLKNKTYGLNTSVKIRCVENETDLREQKFNLKDHFEEIFAGLTWLA